MYPKTITLIRHGQSLGNIDVSAYNKLPDHAIPLTNIGKQQAYELGKDLLKENTKFIISPWRRTRETFIEISKAFAKFELEEDPRIREQEWGNMPDGRENTVDQRNTFGKFYYRYANGESCADVYLRITSFFESLQKDFENTTYENLVIITHGETIKVMLMYLYGLSVNQYERL